MAILQKQWADGDSLAIRYETDEEEGIGSATFLSDANEGVDREMEVSFITRDRTITVTRTVRQEGVREAYTGSDGEFRDINGDRYLALKEEYKDIIEE